MKKKSDKPTYEELEYLLAECERRREGSGGLGFKIAKKGGVSIYGLGRYPVTLYFQQWIRLLNAGIKLREFLEAGRASGKLKVKRK